MVPVIVFFVVDDMLHNMGDVSTGLVRYTKLIYRGNRKNIPGTVCFGTFVFLLARPLGRFSYVPVGTITDCALFSTLSVFKSSTIALAG